MNGKVVRVAGICKFCKSKLSANSNVGTGHFLRHQKSCRKKVDHATMVQTRLAFNPNRSLRN
jgi:predicted nucleic acid binding AN1-type Zn finger protein